MNAANDNAAPKGFRADGGHLPRDPACNADPKMGAFVYLELVEAEKHLSWPAGTKPAARAFPWATARSSDQSVLRRVALCPSNEAQIGGVEVPDGEANSSSSSVGGYFVHPCGDAAGTRSRGKFSAPLRLPGAQDTKWSFAVSDRGEAVGVRGSEKGRSSMRW